MKTKQSNKSVVTLFLVSGLFMLSGAQSASADDGSTSGNSVYTEVGAQVEAMSSQFERVGMSEDKIRKVLNAVNEPNAIETPIAVIENSQLGGLINKIGIKRMMTSVTTKGLKETTRKVLTDVATREAEAVGKRFGIDVSADLTLKDVGNQLNEKRERLIASASTNGLKQTAREVLTEVASREVEALGNRFGMDVNADDTLKEVSKEMAGAGEQLRSIEAEALHQLLNSRGAKRLKNFLLGN